VREEEVGLIGAAYASIGGEEVGRRLGQSTVDVSELAKGRGWTLSPHDGMLCPKQDEGQGQRAATSSAEPQADTQMASLTTYVSFLEN
jgi:hypothetical protein